MQYLSLVPFKGINWNWNSSGIQKKSISKKVCLQKEFDTKELEKLFQTYRNSSPSICTLFEGAKYTYKKLEFSPIEYDVIGTIKRIDKIYFTVSFEFFVPKKILEEHNCPIEFCQFNNNPLCIHIAKMFHQAIKNEYCNVESHLLGKSWEFLEGDSYIELKAKVGNSLPLKSNFFHPNNKINFICKLLLLTSIPTLPLGNLSAIIPLSFWAYRKYIIAPPSKPIILSKFVMAAPKLTLGNSLKKPTHKQFCVLNKKKPICLSLPLQDIVITSPESKVNDKKLSYPPLTIQVNKILLTNTEIKSNDVDAICFPLQIKDNRLLLKSTENNKKKKTERAITIIDSSLRNRVNTLRKNSVRTLTRFSPAQKFKNNYMTKKEIQSEFDVKLNLRTYTQALQLLTSLNKQILPTPSASENLTQITSPIIHEITLDMSNILTYGRLRGAISPVDSRQLIVKNDLSSDFLPRDILTEIGNVFLNDLLYAHNNDDLLKTRTCLKNFERVSRGWWEASSALLASYEKVNLPKEFIAKAQLFPKDIDKMLNDCVIHRKQIVGTFYLDSSVVSPSQPSKNAISSALPTHCGFHVLYDHTESHDYTLLKEEISYFKHPYFSWATTLIDFISWPMIENLSLLYIQDPLNRPALAMPYTFENVNSTVKSKGVFVLQRVKVDQLGKEWWLFIDKPLDEGSKNTRVVCFLQDYDKSNSKKLIDSSDCSEQVQVSKRYLEWLNSFLTGQICEDLPSSNQGIAGAVDTKRRILQHRPEILNIN